MVVHGVIQTQLNLVVNVQLLLNVFVQEVLLAQPHFGLKNFLVFFVQLAKHFNQVKTGTLAQPVQVLLPSELLLKLLNAFVSTFAKVIWPSSYFSE